MNQCVVLVRYLRLAFWPHPLLCDYGPPVPLTFGAVLPYAGLLAALLAATSAALIYRLKVGFLGAWFFVILIPTSSFVPILTEVGAERRMYLPLAAVIVLVVIGGDLLLQYAAQYAETARRNWARPDTSGLISRGGGIVQVAIALVLSVMTVKRNAEYRHPITLWKQAVTQVPNNARAHTNLGVAQVDQGDIATAIGHYRCGLELDPGDPVTHNNLGFALAIQGTLDEAIAHYRRALKQDPDYTAAHANLAAALVAQGQFDLAIHHFRRVVELDPGKSVVHNDLGAALSALGDIDAAIAQFHRSLELDPDYMIARQNLALVLELKNEQVKKPGGRGQ